MCYYGIAAYTDPVALHLEVVDKAHVGDGDEEIDAQCTHNGRDTENAKQPVRQLLRVTVDHSVLA